MNELKRDLIQYEKCTPEAVSQGSQAQMYYFALDAKSDILTLATRIEALEAENARLKDESKAERLVLKALLDEAISENARLREALEPFSDIANLIDSETEGMSDTDGLELHYHGYLMASWPVSMFRAARRAREGGNADG